MPGAIRKAEEILAEHERHARECPCGGGVKGHRSGWRPYLQNPSAALDRRNGRPSETRGYFTNAIWQDHLSTTREAGRLAEDSDGLVGPNVPLVDRQAFRAEWANEVDRFTLVVEAHDAGRLPRHLVAELLRVAKQLSDLLPLLERLKLLTPDAADLDRLKATSAA